MVCRTKPFWLLAFGVNTHNTNLCLAKTKKAMLYLISREPKGGCQLPRLKGLNPTPELMNTLTPADPQSRAQKPLVSILRLRCATPRKGNLKDETEEMNAIAMYLQDNQTAQARQLPALMI